MKIKYTGLAGIERIEIVSDVILGAAYSDRAGIAENAQDVADRTAAMLAGLCEALAENGSLTATQILDIAGWPGRGKFIED